MIAEMPRQPQGPILTSAELSLSALPGTGMAHLRVECGGVVETHELTRTFCVGFRDVLNTALDGELTPSLAMLIASVQ